MRFGMQSYKMEDDLVQEDVVVSDPEVQADAQEAQANIEEVVQLCDAIDTYNEAAGDLQLLENEHGTQVQVMDGDYAVTNGEIKVMVEDDVTINVDAKELGEAVGNDAGEVLTPESTDADADEAAAKLERDLSGILTKVQGSLFTSRFARSAIGRKENDFKLTGKRGYRAKVEGISEVGQKVWEHIKAFFAKIWEFMKSLFERFTALFKSNKSVLEGLKKKLEGMEDDDLSEFKDKGEVGEALAAYTEFKDLDKHVLATPDKFSTKVNNVMKGLTTKQAKDVELKQSNGLSFNDDAHAYKAEQFSNLKNAKGSLMGVAGVSGEGLVFWGRKDGSFFTLNAKIKNPKKFSGAKSGARDMLIDLCDIGIDMCSELDGSLIKDAEKSFNDNKKESEDLIKELWDKDRTKEVNGKQEPDQGNKNNQKVAQKVLTSSVSTLSKVIATVGNQPSQIVTAVRQGMSLYSPSKK